MAKIALRPKLNDKEVSAALRVFSTNGRNRQMKCNIGVMGRGEKRRSKPRSSKVRSEGLSTEVGWNSAPGR